MFKSRNQLKPDILGILIEDAIIYNCPNVLKELLAILSNEDSDDFFEIPYRTCALLYLLDRPECKNVYQECNIFGVRIRLSFSELSKIINRYSDDIKDEIIRNLQQSPDYREFPTLYFPDNSMVINPSHIKLFIELTMQADDSETLVEHYSKEGVFVRLLHDSIFADDRETIKLLIGANLDFDVGHDDGDIIRVAIENDIRNFRLSKNAYWKTSEIVFHNIESAEIRFYNIADKHFLIPRVYEKIDERTRYMQNEVFRTDTWEHGRLGFEGQDFALNFTAPFLLECGWQTTRSTLEMYLEKHMPSSELDYFRACIQSTYDRPISLARACRVVLRRYFKGRKIHKFLEIRNCPKPIKNYILMKHLVN